MVNGKEYSNDLLEYSEGRGNPNITLISESGLYRILAKCNLPKCEPWFVAKDVCDCLEIADVSQACKNLDDDEKQVVARSPELSLLFTESSNAPTMTLISESGLYRILAKCNLPKCEPWFVAKDVCDCLELGNVLQTCSRLYDDEGCIILNDTPSGKQEMLVVSEPGLYSLIGSSKKQEAKAFKRWVTHEVLPSICKTGRKLV